MWKCCADEVSTPVVALAVQCIKGVQLNQANYLCSKFLANCHEADEQGKTFHYAWLLLSIVLVAWELPEDSQFPLIALDLLEAAKYASLWETKYAQCIRESKIFSVLMEMNIRMGINHKPQLLPTVYKSLHSFAELKADFHHDFIRAQKDPMNTWHDLPYLATDNVIFAVLESWPSEWRAPASSMVEMEKSIAQYKKEETKLWMAQLAEKSRREEAIAKSQVAHDAMKLSEKQQKIGEEECEGQQ